MNYAWNVNLPSSISCTSKISNGSGLDQTVAYSAGATTTVFPNPTYSDIDGFFFNSDTTNCAIDSCILSDAGACGTGTKSWTTEISMLSTPPFTITVSQGVAAGWSYSVCLECSTPNGDDTNDADNWDITQSALDCSSVLSTPSGILAPTHSYTAGSTVTEVP